MSRRRKSTLAVMGSKPAKFDAIIKGIHESRLPSPVVRRQIRETARVSLRESAAALGVAPMTYLRWERGEVEPRRAHAIEYRQFLDALTKASA
jgi:DNA-binding XRE family transcriptional regulator